MANREELELKFQVQERVVTVRAMDTIGVEDAYQVIFDAVLHRFATGEDAVPTTSREIKDWLLKSNLSI